MWNVMSQPGLEPNASGVMYHKLTHSHIWIPSDVNTKDFLTYCNLWISIYNILNNSLLMSKLLCCWHFLLTGKHWIHQVHPQIQESYSCQDLEWTGIHWVNTSVAPTSSSHNPTPKYQSLHMNYRTIIPIFRKIISVWHFMHYWNCLPYRLAFIFYWSYMYLYFRNPTCNWKQTHVKRNWCTINLF